MIKKVLAVLASVGLAIFCLSWLFGNSFDQMLMNYGVAIVIVVIYISIYDWS